MSDWAKTIYGDPCKECGFGWPAALATNLAVVRDVPAETAELVDGHPPTLKHPALDWSIGQYVCHMADNLRIYAERFAAIASGFRGTLAEYDQDALATAMRYERVPFESSLWALQRSAQSWCETADAIDLNAIVTHPERGQQTGLDLVLSSAHDAHHHVWDVRRSIEAHR